MIIESVERLEAPQFVRLNLFEMKLVEHMNEHDFVLLQEALQKEVPLVDVTQTFKNKFGYLKNFKVFKHVDSGEHAITFEKNGAAEIHHTDADYKSGSILTKEHGATGPNIRFVSMMVQLGKQFIQQGKQVRIVAPEEMCKKYHRIAKMRGVGLDNVEITDPQFHEVGKDANDNDVDYHSFYIKPTAITEAVRLLSA